MEYSLFLKTKGGMNILQFNVNIEIYPGAILIKSTSMRMIDVILMAITWGMQLYRVPQVEEVRQNDKINLESDIC